MARLDWDMLVTERMFPTFHAVTLSAIGSGKFSEGTAFVGDGNKLHADYFMTQNWVLQLPLESKDFAEWPGRATL